MHRLIIAALITLLTFPAFAADAPNDVKPKTPVVNETAANSIYSKIAAANKAFYDKAAKEKGMIKTGSGLLYKSLREGNGASPGIMSTVKVHYRGTLVNHQEFKNTYKSGKPAEHRLNRVFSCWQEGLQKMKVGGKAKLVCPPELAFRANGAASVVPPNAIVIYEIELLGVK